MDFSGGGSSNNTSFDDFETFEDTGSEEIPSEEPLEDDTLPSPADLDIGDVSDSTNPELEQ
jgi:hypothetical protein